MQMFDVQSVEIVAPRGIGCSGRQTMPRDEAVAEVRQHLAAAEG
jgi:hypothetical protein